jgi:hypothetical protein
MKAVTEWSLTVTATLESTNRTHCIHSTSVVITQLDSTKGTEGGFPTVVPRRPAPGTVRGIAQFTEDVIYNYNERALTRGGVLAGEDECMPFIHYRPRLRV